MGNFEVLNHGGVILTNKPLGSGINLKTATKITSLLSNLFRHPFSFIVAEQ